MKFLFFKKTKGADSDLSVFIKSSLGISSKNPDLYLQAFRHKSVAKKGDVGILASNERLEFLGDSVISTIVSEYLYEKYPDKSEGFLTQMRSKIVNRNNLNYLGKQLHLEQHIKYLKAPTKHKSLLGNVFEALFGAIYLDKGYQVAKNILINNVIELHLDLEALETTTTDFKSELLIYCQKNKLSIVFNPIKEETVGSNIYFTIGIVIDNELKATARESSKRKAEQQASKIVLEDLL